MRVTVDDSGLKLQALEVYDILPSVKVPESDARSVLRSMMLSCLCDVFRALINSLVGQLNNNYFKSVGLLSFSSVHKQRPKGLWPQGVTIFGTESVKDA